MRVLALLTSAACAIAGGACSNVLGIEDPTPDDGGDGGDTGDGGDGGPTDRVVFSVGDFQLAQLQRARLHAFLVLLDGTMQDATANATYETDNPAVAAVPAPGQVDAGSQAGTATLSARLGAARAGTVKVTVTPKQCQPVINELQTGGAASPDDEWVEILNPCTAAIDVDGWTIVYRGPNTTGTQDAMLMVTLAGQLAPGELRLFAGPGFTGTSDGGWTSGIMGQSNGAIALRSGAVSAGPIVDAVAYGTVASAHPFVETAALPPMVNGRSAQRLPFDGRDDDNGGADFMQVGTPSPRALNAP